MIIVGAGYARSYDKKQTLKSVAIVSVKLCHVATASYKSATDF